MCFTIIRFLTGFLLILFHISAAYAQGQAKDSTKVRLMRGTKGSMIVKTNLPSFIVGNYPVIIEYFAGKDLSFEIGAGITGRNYLFVRDNGRILKEQFLVNEGRSYPAGFSYQFGFKYFLPRQPILFMLHYNRALHNMDYPLEGNVPGFTGVQRETYDYRILSALFGLQYRFGKRIQGEIMFGPGAVTEKISLFEEQSEYGIDGRLIRKTGTYETSEQRNVLNFLARIGYVLK